MALGIYRAITNKETGEQNLETGCKLLSYGNARFENSNGTGYFLATVEFVDQQGQMHEVTATIWESNFEKGVEVGKEYLLTIAPGDSRGPLLNMSALEYRPVGKRATADMFNFEKAAAPVEFGG